MTPRRLPPPLAIALGWAACLTLFAPFRDRLAAATEEAEWLAVVLLGGGATLLWLVLAGRIGALWRERLTAWVLPGLLPAALLVAAAGGVRSPAVAVLALGTLGVTARRGAAAGAAAGVAALALACLADLWLGRAPVPAPLVGAAAVVLAGGVLPVLHLRRSLADGDAARRRLARVEGYVVRRSTPPHAAPAAPLSPEQAALAERADRVLRLRSLEEYLREVRDRTGADEVVLWRDPVGEGEPRASALSTEGADLPRYFDEERWGPLRRWAAEAEIVHADREDDVVRCVAAPVGREGRRYGALTIASRAGLTLTHQGALEWAGRYARHVGLLVELFDIRADRGRVRSRERALLSFVEAIHQAGTAEGAMRSACAAALQVSGAARAALVQWDSRLEEGTVRAASAGHPVPERSRVSADSVVGRQCAARLPLHLSDARALSLSGAAVYGGGDADRRREIGALSIVPLLHERVAVGAIVVEAEEPEGISSAAQGSLRLLAFLAAAALPTFEQKDEAARSARTDALTGLHNRRHFDEELARVLSDAGRHRDETSLVIADVDHFKRVNDSYGHEAGDAVLRHVARLLADRVRPTDVLARFGGEEVVILCPRTGLDGARQLAERLREAIAAAPIRHGGVEIAVTASFGVASHPRSVRDADALLGAADEALYAAKREGRNRVRAADATRASATV